MENKSKVGEGYLQVVYPQEEYSAKMYPQKLCNYISENYFGVKKGYESTKLLDVGSGKGNHIVGFSRLGYDVYGLDKRDECVGVLDNYTIKECDIETEVFPYEDNYFDYVFSKSVIEHISNIENFLLEIRRVLKPGGVAVIMTPAWESQYKFFWDDYTHVSAFTRKSLQNAMRMNGFKGVTCEHFLQLPFLWKYPILKVFTNIVALLPDSTKWKDKQQSDARKLIRFSKEQMLLAVGEK